MWPFGIWFGRHGGVGGMVGLDLRGLFQPMILRICHIRVTAWCNLLPKGRNTYLPSTGQLSSGKAGPVLGGLYLQITSSNGSFVLI